MKKSGKKKRILQLALTFLINFLIVGYIALKEFGSEMGRAQHIKMRDIQLFYLIPAVGCFVLAAGMEYVKYRRMIMTIHGRDDRRGAFTCAMLGKYYDNVTPFGAGGQPFQILYLRKRGLSTGAAAALPAAGFIVLQIAFVLVAGVVFIANRNVIDAAPVIRVSAYVGLLFYLFIPLCLIFFTVLPRPFRAAARGCARLLGKMRILKDGEATASRLLDTLGEYVESIRVLNRRRFFFLRQLLYSVIYQMAILSVPFFVLRAFGGTNDWWTVFSLVTYVYAAITIIPTPGNAGAAEGSFYAVFSSLEGGFLFWAMLVWRAIVYYAWLAVGLVIVARSAVNRPARRKPPIPVTGPLKAAVFTDRFYPEQGETAAAADALAREIEAEGGYACLFCPKDDPAYRDRMDYDVRRVPAIRLPGLLPAAITRPDRELRAFAREKRFDVFFVHTPHKISSLAVSLGRKLDVPVVALLYPACYDGGRRGFVTAMRTNRAVDVCSRSDEVWTRTEAQARTLRACGYYGEIRVMENSMAPLPPDNGAVPEPKTE